MKLQVAIIGSPGSGKSVLTAVLSRYLSGHSDKIYMNPKGAYQYQGNTTTSIPSISYINGILDRLHQGEWPLATPQDQKFELGFELHIGRNIYEMKLLDSGGEDLQAIWLNYDKTALSPFRKKIYDYILSSNVVILIVNLEHFADAPTITARGENENVLKEAVDHLVKGRVCHHILVCFTAHDKYKAHIDQNYGGSLVNYLRSELSMFYRSCEAASRTVVRDYTEYERGLQKTVSVECIAVAPVVAQRPSAEVKHERVGKPPIGFDIRNEKHSWGIEQIEKWLCECEQSEREWSMIDEEMKNHKEWLKITIYRVLPIVIGTALGFAAPFCLIVLNADHALTFTEYVPLFFNCLIFGGGIGAGLGAFVGNKAMEAIPIGNNGGRGANSPTSHPTGTDETSAASEHPTGTGGTSTASPSPSRRRGTSGSVNFDDDDDDL